MNVFISARAGKRPTRLPEASFLMLPFAPCHAPPPLTPSPSPAAFSAKGDDLGWELEKLGSWVRAADVVPGAYIIDMPMPLIVPSVRRNE